MDVYILGCIFLNTGVGNCWCVFSLGPVSDAYNTYLPMLRITPRVQVTRRVGFMPKSGRSWLFQGPKVPRLGVLKIGNYVII